MIINTLGNLIVNHTEMVFIIFVLAIGAWTLHGIVGGWRDWHTRY